jgi:glucose-6-phosphate 1-epimerase
LPRLIVALKSQSCDTKLEVSIMQHETNPSRSDIEVSGHVTLKDGPASAPLIVLQNRSGAQAQVSSFGAHLLSWCIPEGKEQLFMSSRADLSGTRSIRGGVPIVFPQFSGDGPLPAHGFARTAMWMIQKSSVEDDGERVSVTFGLTNDSKTEAIWPHQFAMELTTELVDTLTQTWAIKNIGNASFSFQQLLHTYFSISDITHVGVRGLEGCEFFDQVVRQASKYEAPEVYIEGEVDNICKAVPAELELFDYKAERGIRIQTKNLSDAVLWNPWIEKSKKMSDLSPADYKSFVCLEAGNVTHRITLEPGQSFEASQRLSVF